MCSCGSLRGNDVARGLDRRLFGLMVREELRLHKSVIGPFGSSFFPAMIFLFSVVLAVTFPRLGSLDLPTVLLMLHVAALLFGLSVGALGRIGEEVMTRRLGSVSLILGLPQTQPLSFRRAMAIFYLKDATYYVLYAILPIVAGIAVSAPLTGVPLGSVGLLGFSLFLAFMIGMSVSFLASIAWTRSRPATLAAALATLALVLLVWPLNVLAAGAVLLPLGFWAHKEAVYLVASALLALLLSVSGIVFTKERFETRARAYKSALLSTERTFAFARARRTLVAKEWLELRRSGGLGAVVGGFLGPLVAVYVLAWIFRAGIGVPITFNVVFYGAMVGFLGVMVWSWLTNVETNEFLDEQPVTLGEVIRAKLVLYFLLTTAISYAYVIAIGLLDGQADLLPVALLVAAATTAYVAGVVARLTGIWTNTMLFDARVLVKFAAAVIPPLVTVAILSFVVGSDPWQATILLAALSLGLLGAAKLLLDAVGRRWEREPFSRPTHGGREPSES